MAETLNTIERRVLGVLIEKSLAQPQYYPMTLNAIVTACNQKSNRDPVMTLGEDAVWNTLEVLQAAGLVTRLLPGGASRVDRFKHEVKTRLGWEKPQWAVMAELLLRGPQTVGELRGRCSRMYQFENTDAVAAVLDGLGHQDPPRVATLPRAPGQSAVRFAHMLYPPEEWDVVAQPPASGATVAQATAGAAPQPPPTRIGERGAEVERLRQTVEDLETMVAELDEGLSDLRRRVEALEGR
jgi:uncharacterized protein YceH (UPF0502 family)